MNININIQHNVNCVKTIRRNASSNFLLVSDVKGKIVIEETHSTSGIFNWFLMAQYFIRFIAHCIQDKI